MNNSSNQQGTNEFRVENSLGYEEKSVNSLRELEEICEFVNGGYGRFKYHVTKEMLQYPKVDFMRANHLVRVLGSELCGEINSETTARECLSYKRTLEHMKINREQPRGAVLELLGIVKRLYKVKMLQATFEEVSTALKGDLELDGRLCVCKGSIRTLSPKFKTLRRALGNATNVFRYMPVVEGYTRYQVTITSLQLLHDEVRRKHSFDNLDKVIDFIGAESLPKSISDIQELYKGKYDTTVVKYLSYILSNLGIRYLREQLKDMPVFCGMLLGSRVLLYVDNSVTTEELVGAIGARCSDIKSYVETFGEEE